MQSVHQNLIRPGALIEAGGVDIRCVHGDIHTYPVVLVEIQFKGEKHSTFKSRLKTFMFAAAFHGRFSLSLS